MPTIRLLLISFFILIVSDDVFAGAAVQQRQQQMQGGQQQAQEQAYAQAYQQAQQEAYNQAVAQKQQQEMQAYQEAVAQQQAAQMQAARAQVMQIQSQQMIQAQINAYVQKTRLAAVQQAQLKQAVEQQLSQKMAVQIQQGQAAQIQEELVAQTIASAAQSIAGQQALQAVQTVQAVEAARDYELGQALVAGAKVAQSKQRNPNNDFVQEIVDISELWMTFERNSKAWSLIIDDQIKVMTVNEFIERFRKEGTRIDKPPGTYAQMIDDMSSQNTDLLTKPFKDLIMLLAIMEYDFNNGLDKDMMARKMLGDEFYRKNRQRLGK